MKLLRLALVHYGRKLLATPALAYAISASLAALIVFNWFQADFIAAGDVGPFERSSLASEAGAIWNHQQTGAGSTSIDIGRAVEAWLIELTSAAGGNAQLAQRLLYMAIAGLGAAGTVHLCRIATSKLPLLIAAGMLSLLNPWVALHSPNPVLLMAIGATAGLCGQLLVPMRGGKQSSLAIAAWALPLVYLSLNLAAVAVTVGAAIVCAVLGVVGAHQTSGVDGPARNTLVGLGLAALVNIWWAAPTVWVLLTGVSGAEQAIVSDVEQWSWSHGQNSLANVVTLTAHWGWVDSSIFPWASGPAAGPWSVLRWGLPVGALGGLALLYRSGGGARKLSILGASTIVILALVMKGLHSPFPGLNRFMYTHLPGFWVLREPVSKVGPLLLVLEILLLIVLADRVVASGATVRVHAQRWFRPNLLAGGLLVAIPIAVGWPVATGAMVPSDRGELLGLNVDVPLAWYEVTDAVNRTISGGKVMVLPVNDYYQVTTSWGYHGVDNVPQQLLDEPVVQLYPGGYYSGGAEFNSVARSVQSRLLSGDVDGASEALSALGVRALVVRHDLTPGPLRRDLPDSRQLADMAVAIEGASLLESTTVASAVRLPTDGTFRAVDTLVNLIEVAPAGAGGLTTISGRWARTSDTRVATATAIVSSSRGDEVVDVDIVSGRGLVMTTDRSGTRTFTPRIANDDAEWTLELVASDHVMVDGELLVPPSRLDVKLAAEPVGLIMDGGVVPLAENASLSLDLGAVTGIATVESDLFGGFSEVGDCAANDDKTLDEAGIEATFSGRSVSLSAREHAACVVAMVAPHPYELIELSATVTTEAFRAARICVWAGGRCVLDRRFGAGSSSLSEVVAVPADTPAEVFVYSYAVDDKPATVEYADVSIRGISTQDDVSPIAGVSSVELPTGLPRVITIGGSGGANLVGDRRPVGDCNRLDDRSLDEAGITLTEFDGGFRLTANAHSACVSFEVSPVGGTGEAVVSYAFRQVGGRSPRVCLWDRSSESCLIQETLDSDGSWQVRSATVPVDQLGSAELFFYADGHPDTTISEYRDIEIAKLARTEITIQHPSSELPGEVGLIHGVSGAAEVNIDMAGSKSAIVVMAESYSPRWSATTLPDGWTAEHFVADGYANGWILRGTGSGLVRLEFATPGWVRLSWAMRWLGVFVVGAQMVMMLSGAKAVRRAVSPARLETTVVVVDRDSAVRAVHDHISRRSHDGAPAAGHTRPSLAEH